MTKLDMLLGKLKNLRLTAIEREQVRRQLLAYMELKPVRKPETLRHSKQEGSVPGILSLIARRRYMVIGLILALLVSAGGGMAVAAEKAPATSEFLHTFKVEVNERVKAALAFSADAKADKEVEFAENRLEEAEKAAVNGRLDADIRARLEANFAAHADRVKARITELEARGKTEQAAHLASVFEASLKAHENILSRLAEAVETGDIDSKAELQTVLKNVNERAEQTVEIREKVEAGVETRADVRAAAEGKMTAATNKIAEVEKFIASQEAKLGAEATASAKAQLVVAQNTFAAGKAKFEAGAFGEAFALFQKSMRQAQEAKLLAQAKADLNIDVRIQGENADDKSKIEIDLKDRLETRDKLEIKLGQ